MLGSCEYAYESPEHQLEPAFRVLKRKLRDWLLFSYNELQFWNQIHNQLGVGTQGLLKGVAPDAQFGFTLAQKRTDQALKGLDQSTVWDVTLVLVKLA